MARGKKEDVSVLTIGIAGRGETSGKNAVALLDDLIDAHDGDVRFILAVADEDWNDTYDAIVDWIDEEKFDYDAVYDQDAKKDKDLSEIIANATSKHQVQQVSRKVVAELEKAPEPRELVVLWDEEAVDKAADDDIGEEPGYAAVEAADERGIKASDLTKGLEKITFTDDDSDSGDDARKDDDVSDEEENLPTRKQLEKMDRDELKERATKAGLDLPARAHTPTIVDALDKHYEALAAGDADEPENDGGGEEEDDEEWIVITKEIVVDALEETVKAIGVVMREAVEEIVREGRKDATELGKRIKEGFDDLGAKSTGGDKSVDDDEDRPRRRRSSSDDDAGDDDRPRRGRSSRGSDDDEERPRRRARRG